MPSVLSTQAFLERVWPPEGPYCIAFPLKDKYTDGRDGYAHRAYDTIDEAVTAAQAMCFIENLNTYFATHALKQGWLLNEATGKKKVSRTHDNMREGRTFFFDLDVGDGNFKYSSREQALEALQRFLFRTGMPEPLVVSSGGGYHVYFLLSDAIPSAEWRGWADRMRWLASTNKLLVDPSRTTDQSSVLRVVGTKNFKPAVMARVQAITVGDVTDTAGFIAALTEKTEGYTPLATLVRSAQEHVGNMGTAFDGRMTPPDEVFAVCEQMRMFRDDADKISEPHWFVGIGTMRWVEDGVDLCHELSSADPRYTESETQAKIDHWSTKSVPSCAKIELECANDACDRCALKGTGKNPIDIANKVWSLQAKPRVAPAMALAGTPVLIAPPVPPPFPYGLKNAGVTKIVHDTAQDADVEKVVIPYDFFPIAKYKGNRLEPGHSEWVVAVPLEGQKTFIIEDGWIHNNNEFATRMMSADIMLPTANVITEARTYMLNYLKQLQTTHISAQVHDHFGWDYTDSKQSQKTGFVLSRRKFDLKEGKMLPAAMAANMREFETVIQQDGSLAGHLDAMEFYNRPQYRHVQFFYLAALAVPFFYATGHHGMILSATGRSGASKSTTLAAIASQWGPPERYVVNASPSGMSQNARVDRVMAFPNLPVCFDELTNQSSEAINELALSISQAQGRVTLTNARLVRAHRGGIRHSIAVTSSNISLITLINASNAAGEAAIARIIETDFPRGHPNEKVQADRVIRALQANYGWSGPMLIEALAGDHEKIADAIHARSDKLTVDWGLAPVERFTGGCVAAMYEVAVRAKALGLHRFDVDEVMEWFVEMQLPKQRQVMETQGERSSPIEVFSGFIMQHFGEGVRIDADGKGNISGVISVPQSKNLMFRFDIHRQEIWVRVQAFNNYCVEQRNDAAGIANILKRWGVITDTDRRALLEGIPNYPHNRNICYVIDMKHPKIAGIIAQVTPVK